MRIIFKCQKFSLRVLLTICFIFCQFQPGIAYNRKWKIPHALERWRLSLISYKNCELKIKLGWIGARIFCNGYFVLNIFSDVLFCSVCILSQCIEYRINFQNIYTLTYQKTLLQTLFCLILKSSKVYNVSLSLVRGTPPETPFAKAILKYIAIGCFFSKASDIE